MNKQDWSPAFKQQRATWLRKRYRTPLGQRAREVLGAEDGPGLLSELRAAWDEVNHGQTEAWERYARTVLRACGQIRGRHADRRRRQYIKKCIDSLTPDGPDDDEYVETENAASLLALVKQIGEQAHVDDMGPLFLKLWTVYSERYRGDPDCVRENVRRIVTNAAMSSRPLRYIDAVLQNEKRVNRSGKRKAKPAQK